MPLWSAFLISWLGTIIPTVLIVYTLGFFSKWLSARSQNFKKFFAWLFQRTHDRFWRHHEKFGSLSLVIFVAIPLPMTGVWTGAVAAFLFGIPKKKAIILVSLGSLMAGVLVSLIYYGFISFLEFLI
jgi:uncharacterized membrane protein